jgi:putative oxidoreductase
MNKFTKLDFIPLNSDLAWLLLRIWLGLSLFVKHGIEKIAGFSTMQGHFPDPIHIGKTPGLVFALLSDSICSLLVMLGLFTRITSGIIILNLLVVFIFLHGFSFIQDHAQLVYVYLGGYLAIFISGGGKYSLSKNLLFFFK